MRSIIFTPSHSSPRPSDTLHYHRPRAANHARTMASPTAGPSRPAPVSTSPPPASLPSPPHTATSSTSRPINPLALAVEERPGRGRGVFATAHIRAGTVLEDAPVLVLTKEQWEEGRMDDTVLGEYGFCWANGGMALGLGIGESLEARKAGGVRLEGCRCHSRADLARDRTAPWISREAERRRWSARRVPAPGRGRGSERGRGRRRRKETAWC